MKSASVLFASPTVAGLIIGSFNFIASQHCRTEDQKKTLRAQLEFGMSQTRGALSTLQDGAPVLGAINRQEIGDAARKAIGRVLYNDPNISLDGKKFDEGLKKFLEELKPKGNGFDHEPTSRVYGAGPGSARTEGDEANRR